MKRLILILCLLIASPLWAITETDDFARGDADPMSGDWSADGGATCQIVSGVVQSSDNAGQSCNERFTRFLPLSAQSASLTITTLDAGWVGVLLRRSDTGTTFYAAGCNGGIANIWKLVDDAYTSLDYTDLQNCAAGDTISASISGYTITLLKNGGQILQATDGDASIIEGYCGASLEYTSAVTDSAFDDFSCTDASAPEVVAGKHRVVVIE